MNDPKELRTQLNLTPEQLLLQQPLKEEYRRIILTLPLTDEEEYFIREFSGYLRMEGYFRGYSFSAFFNYVTSLAYNIHKAAADPEGETIKHFYKDFFTKKPVKEEIPEV